MAATAALTPTADNFCATQILDYQNPAVVECLRKIPADSASGLRFLQSAHEFICRNVLPVYTIDELQPVSASLTKGRGSCSQRLACLEALARANGIGTQVRALWIAGKFWNPRFPWAKAFIPKRILLAWPQFFVSGEWLGVEKIFGGLNALAIASPYGFSNSGETMFEAIAHTAVDFEGATSNGTSDCACNLSKFVVENSGVFVSRDILFKTFGSFQHTLRGVAFELIYGDRKSTY